MRRTTFLPTTVTAAAVTALLLTGCGSSAGGGTTADGKTGVPPSTAASSPSPSPSSAPPSPSPSPSSSAPDASSASPTPPASPSGCGRTVTLTAADNGHTVCLVKGGEVRVSLDGSKDRPWSSVRAKDTGVLEAVNAGFAVLPGDANAAYRATGTGTARLTSSRPLCASGPHRVACKAIVEWAVTVTVRGS